MGLKFIDFFAGIGGFRLGMEMAGHECVGHCEIDKFADKSYRAMHDVKEDEWYANDIRGVNPGDLPEADCYCGGFPCQAFSIAGKRGGFEDTRGTLFFEVMRLAAIRKPKYIFMENVAGLLSHDGGKTFGTIINTLGQLGYWYEYQVLNSKDFGVPQNRERVFIIGHLGGFSGRKIFPIFGESNEHTTVGESTKTAIARTFTAGGHSGGNHSGMTMICLVKDKIIPRENANTIDAHYYKGLQANQMRSGVLDVRTILTPDREEKRQNGRRIKDPGEPSFTLTAQDKHGIETKGKIRRFTPRECFRLQGFPDEYFDRAAKVNSDSQLYKQAGNSVTRNVIYAIAKKLS